MPNEILIEAENIGKKFCRSLKRSLWYGTKDILTDLNPFHQTKHPAQETKHPEQGTKHETPALRADEFWALQDVSFQLRRGECLGLIGHNGAGKSTLLKILNSLIRPDTGRLTIRGKVGALIELSAGFNPILSGRENIYGRGALLGFSKQEINRKFDAIVDFSEIEEFIDMPVQNYSSGMQVRLGFAVSSQMEPDILILDEVLAVGDVGFQHKCYNAMGKMLRNSAVIFVSHSMPSIYRIASEVLVLDHGKSLFQGDVGQGIDQYHAKQKTSEGTIAGSGQVRVIHCDRIDGDGNKILEQEHDPDTPFRLQVELELDPEVDSALVQAVIWNQQMMPVVDIVAADRKGFCARRIPGSDRVVLEVESPELPLNTGNYNMSICASAESGDTVYCRHDNAVTFRVSRANSSGAHFVVPSPWQQQELPLNHST